MQIAMRMDAAIPLDCDETHWPLAILVAEAAMNVEDIRSGFDRLENWLSHGEPFALLLIVACNPVFLWEATMLQMAAQRIVAVREALHQSLLGIAIVAPTKITDAARQSLARLPLDMPLEIFERSPRAVEWLRQTILAPAGLAVDSL